MSTVTTVDVGQRSLDPASARRAGSMSKPRSSSRHHHSHLTPRGLWSVDPLVRDTDTRPTPFLFPSVLARVRLPGLSPTPAGMTSAGGAARLASLVPGTGDASAYAPAHVHTPSTR
jgi:hypothetical protein